MDKLKLASYLDLANHHSDATWTDIEKVCEEVKKYHFNAAFMNPCYVAAVKAKYEGVKIGTVVAFPLGQETRDVKIISCLAAAKAGADELDIQMNVGFFKAKKYKEVAEEMSAIVESAKSYRSNIIIKFIIETGFLTDVEIKKASEMVLESRADFVKTCSGMGPRGAEVNDVNLIKEAIGDKIRIKVAGGVVTYEQAISFIEAGAVRIGTSKAVEIVEEIKQIRKSNI